MAHRNKTIPVLLSAFLLFSAAGCGQPSGTGAPGGSAAAAPEGPASSASAAAADVKLAYWDMLWSDDEGYQPAVTGLAKAYTEKTGVGVEVQFIPWDNHYQTFLTAINAGTAPDVCTGGAFQAIQYASMGEALDLSSIIEAWKNDGSNILDDFVPGAIELQQYGGKQAGIPWNTDVREMYYRTDYLKEAGYEGEAAYGTKTWDEFLDILRAVKKAKPDVIPFAFPAGDYTATHVMLSFMAANGTGVTDENYQANLASPAFIELLQFFSTCREEGLLSDSAATYLDADISRLYASGNIAVVWSGNPTYLNNYDDVRANTDLMEALTGPSGKEPLNLVWTNPMIAFSQTQHPEEAKDFIKWWIENNKSVYIDGKTGSLPVRQSYFADPYFSENWLPSRISERKLLETASSPVYPAANLYPEIADIEGNNYIGQALQRVLLGDTDFEAIAAEANASVEEALKLTTNA